MKRARKSIASIIVITFIVTCIGNYKAVYAEGEQSLEVNYATEELNESNVKFATEEVKNLSSEDTEIISEEETNDESEKEEEVVLEENEDITEEMLPEADEEEHEELIKDEAVASTEEVKKAELVEDNIEDELEVVEQPAVLEIVETYGNIYDFKNYYNNYIKVIFKQGPKIHDVKVTMVKSDDPSKIIIYDNYEDCSNYEFNMYVDKSSILDNGIYEIGKVEAIAYTNYGDDKVAYINPKFKDVISTEGIEFVEEHDFTGKTIEVKNYKSINYSFEEFSVVDNPTNGYEFGATIKIKSDKEITSMGAFLKCGLQNVYLTSSTGFDENGELNTGNITKDGDIYTINLVPTLYAEESTPLEYMKSGEYQVSFLTFCYNDDKVTTVPVKLTDERFKNENVYVDGSYDFSPLDITCNNPKEDIVGPVIDDIIVEKSNGVIGDELIVKVMISDNLSGFKNYINGYSIWTKIGDETFKYYAGYDFEADGKSGCFTIKISITDEFEPGEYIMTAIGLHDACYNGVEYTLENNYELLSKTILKVTDKNGSGSGDGGAGAGDSGNDSNNKTDEDKKPVVEVKPGAGNNNITTGNNSTTNTTVNRLPSTGSVVSSTFVVFLGMILTVGGAFVIFKKREEII